MKIFDFNLHLVPPEVALSEALAADLSLPAAHIPERVQAYQPTFQAAQISAGNLMLFNPHLAVDDLAVALSTTRTLLPGLVTWMADFRHPQVLEQLEVAWAAGVRSVMFQSYLQKITPADSPDVLRVARFVAARNGLICVDTSYGTSRMYAYDNLHLAAFLSECITTPMVLIHAGGLRILEAMLLADLQPNIYLETSFSVDYYRGSSIAQDFAFAFRKLGAQRILYGSDFPYVEPTQAAAQMQQYLEEHRFSSAEQAAIMGENGRSLWAACS